MTERLEVRRTVHSGGRSKGDAKAAAPLVASSSEVPNL